MLLQPKITKSVTCPDELGALASQVTGDYSQLAVQGRLAAHTAEPEEVRLSWDRHLHSSPRSVHPITLHMTPMCTPALFHGSSVTVFTSSREQRLTYISPASVCVIQIGFQIKTRVQDLGHGCIFLVQKAGALQITPSDSFTKRELIDCARVVTEKVEL